jgi:hypothetical protein
VDTQSVYFPGGGVLPGAATALFYSTNLILLHRRYRGLGILRQAWTKKAIFAKQPECGTVKSRF